MNVLLSVQKGKKGGGRSLRFNLSQKRAHVYNFQHQKPIELYINLVDIIKNACIERCVVAYRNEIFRYLALQKTLHLPWLLYLFPLTS